MPLGEGSSFNCFDWGGIKLKLRFTIFSLISCTWSPPRHHSWASWPSSEGLDNFYKLLEMSSGVLQWYWDELPHFFIYLLFSEDCWELGASSFVWTWSNQVSSQDSKEIVHCSDWGSPRQQFIVITTLLSLSILSQLTDKPPLYFDNTHTVIRYIFISNVLFFSVGTRISFKEMRTLNSVPTLLVTRREYVLPRTCLLLPQFSSKFCINTETIFWRYRESRVT